MIQERRRAYHKGLSRAAVVDAAVAVAAEGRDISIRLVADRLRVRPASVYGHVDGVDQLISLTLAAVHEEMACRVDTNERWQDALRTVARHHRDRLRRYPGLVALIARRPLPDDCGVTSLDNLLMTLESAGFDTQAALCILGVMDLLVIGASLDANAEPHLLGGLHRGGHPGLRNSIDLIDALPDRADQLFEYALDRLVDSFERELHG